MRVPLISHVNYANIILFVDGIGYGATTGQRLIIRMRREDDNQMLQATFIPKETLSFCKKICGTEKIRHPHLVYDSFDRECCSVCSENRCGLPDMIMIRQEGLSLALFQSTPHEVEWIKVCRIDDAPLDVLHKTNCSAETGPLPLEPPQPTESEI